MSVTHQPTTGAQRADEISVREGARPGQAGYALVALLALMTLMVIAMMSAVPSLRQQNQRELEKEAIVRGEEVAEAIRLYVNYTGKPPTSIDELLEGAPFGVKKVQVLRAYAARDPLSASGEWRLVRPNDPAFIEFVKAVALYNNGRVPVTSDDKLKSIPIPQFGTILDTKTKEEAPGDEDTSSSSSGPFIGVASRSRRDSVLTYYDIERQDKWVFTPLFK
ncbi:MAG TPA: hypothetical protein VM934_03915 [Pyrinomonadaceae bacterium]|jgi:type II secretory pathway pseudopilin PulG|nr:hypothetical protein [Pyrinomonadaceae bacterium]